MKLTAVIICRSRKEKGVKRALRSVEFADEILVEERRETGDFAAARNEALAKAMGEWVMFVDSDEEIGEKLKKEIRRITDKGYKDYKNYPAERDPAPQGNISGAYFRRTDRFLGKWLNHGETASVKLLRLARKNSGRWERPVHEVWKVGGKILHLKNPILHYSHESVDGMVEKLDRYSGIEAEYRFSHRLPLVVLRAAPRYHFLDTLGQEPSLTSSSPLGQSKSKVLPGSSSIVSKIISSGQHADVSPWAYRLIISIQMVFFPLFKFVWNYFFRLGFLDGMEGLIHAFLMSGHSFLVRAKILSRYELKYLIL